MASVLNLKFVSLPADFRWPLTWELPLRVDSPIVVRRRGALRCKREERVNTSKMKQASCAVALATFIASPRLARERLAGSRRTAKQIGSCVGTQARSGGIGIPVVFKELG